MATKFLPKLITATLLFSTSLSLYAAPFTTEQEQRVKELVRETLTNNPEILKEMAIALQAKEEKQQQEMQQKAIIENKNALYNDPNSPRIGVKDAKLAVVYFTDYNCQFCHLFDPVLLTIQQKHPDVAIILKQLPFLGAGSKFAAEYAANVWATQPEKFAELHKALMTSGVKLDEKAVVETAKKINLDNIQPTDKDKKTVEQNLSLARALGINGTPSTIIGNTIYSGALSADQLEDAIETELAAIK